MKKILYAALAVSMLVAIVPALAGEEGHKCSADAQTCLNYLAEKFQGRGWAGVDLDYGENWQMSVKTVHAGTPADRAGVKVGDVLLAVNGVRFSDENKEKLAALEAEMKPGNVFTFTTSRKGKERDMEIRLAEMPADVVAAMIGRHMLNDHSAVQIASADD